MTRERASKILMRRTTIPGDEVSFDEINEAIDMAIEALAQPEIIRCGECELKIECCRNIRSGGRKDDDFCSCGRRSERRTE